MKNLTDNNFQSPAEEADDHPSDYYNTVRLVLRIDAEDITFRLESKPSNLARRTTSLIKETQMLCCDSQPLNNKDYLLPRHRYEHQPFANQIFESKKIFVSIKEIPRDDDIPSRRQYHLHHRYDSKGTSQFSFDWHISDRSLFTRLITTTSLGRGFTIILFMREQDKYFEPYTRTEPLKLPNIFGIDGLTLSCWVSVLHKQILSPTNALSESVGAWVLGPCSKRLYALFEAFTQRAAFSLGFLPQIC